MMLSRDEGGCNSPQDIDQLMAKEVIKGKLIVFL